MPSYILSIDQGTTSTRVCLFDQDGILVKQSQKEFKQYFPQPGWVEHDAEEIWETTLLTLRQVVQSIPRNQIVGLGITNQRETVVAWEKETLRPLSRAIVWQCRRTTKECDNLRKQNKESWIYKKTGLVLDPYFSATKIQWMLKHVPHLKQKAQKGYVQVGTVDSFLLAKLTNGKSHSTDVSNASRTMLMNIKTLNWDPDLLKLFGIPEKILPTIQPSNSLFGRVSGLDFLPDDLPIHGILGDQQAALFGQLATKPGEAKCTFGTGSFILMNTGDKNIFSKRKLLSTVAWQLEKQRPVFALEGGAFVCGAAVQWLRDGLGLIKDSSEIEHLASQVNSSEGVQFVPALTGLGAPYWNPEARGMICGLSRGTQKTHLAFATLEAMALQNVDILRTMEKDFGKKIKTLKVDGGAAKNNMLMQMQSDYLGCAVVRPQVFETTALGAFFMTALGVGLFKNIKDIEKIWKQDRRFVAQKSAKQREVRIDRWRQAIEMMNKKTD